MGILPLKDLKNINIMQQLLLFRKFSTHTSKNDHFLMKKCHFLSIFSLFWGVAVAFFKSLCTVR